MLCTRFEDEGQTAVFVYRHDHNCSYAGQDLPPRIFAVQGGAVEVPPRPVCVELGLSLGLVVETKTQVRDGTGAVVSETVTERVGS